MPAGLTKLPKGGTRERNYTFLTFPSWNALDAFIETSKKKFPDATAVIADKNYKDFIEGFLDNLNKNPAAAVFSSYGLFGKHPKTYAEAMARNTFIYYEEYRSIKEQLLKIVQQKLSKTSVAEVMKPKMVLNDRQIGEFIYDRAAMSLIPTLFYYSPSKKKQVDIENEPIYDKKGKMYLVSDDSLVVMAYKVTKEDGSVVFVENTGEESLVKAREIGIISVSSTNKKVYLYKEKKPRIYNAVRVNVCMTMGGWTDWTNDFYTGLAAVIFMEILESLGYAVEVVVSMGGGRCNNCGMGLNFYGQLTEGRRFVIVKVKDFDEQADMDGLLYMLCDPSFHNIKFINYINTIFSLYGDEIDTSGNPVARWHGIDDDHIIYPLGTFLMAQDEKKGRKNLLNFHINRVSSPTDMVRIVKDLVLTAENINLQSLLKYNPNDFKITQ